MLINGLHSGKPTEATPEFWQDFRAQVNQQRNSETQEKIPLIALLDEWDAEDELYELEEAAR